MRRIFYVLLGGAYIVLSLISMFSLAYRTQVKKLANYGASTITHALLSSRSVLDLGGEIACPAVDQRGLPRPSTLISGKTAVCDIDVFDAIPSKIFLPLVIKPDPPAESKTSLNGVEIDTWMYQIQFLDDNAAVDLLANTDYDMLVVEPGNTFKPDPLDPDFSYDTNYIVAQLSQKPTGEPRILLAYIDIGEAEDYRNYWQDSWIAPEGANPGVPEFLVTVDPDGWEGNYPVAYWQQEWKNIWLSPDGIIADLAGRGFDGVYLDWVEAYDDEYIIAFAEQEGVDPEEEMMTFIEEIGEAGRAIYPDFLVVSQNAPYLLDADPTRYASLIDALATEDTWFYGEGDAEWDDPTSGDLSGGDRHADDYSTVNRIEQNKRYLALDIPVFTVDYCISEGNADQVYQDARSNGFIPLVTRVSLSDITETPP